MGVTKTGVSVWERGDGRFGARFRYRAPYGTTKSATTTKPSRKLAEEWAAQKERDHEDGVVSGGETIGRFLDAWLEESVRPARARNTYLKREKDVRVHIKPALGAVTLADLPARAIGRMNAGLAAEGYALETRRSVHVTLKMALKQAVRWGLIRRNPADMVDAPRGNPAARGGDPIRDARHLTDAEARRLFALAEARCSRWRYYYVAVRTGLRPGEMLGLRWGDLDLDSDPGIVRVRRSLDTRFPGAPVYNPPKTARSSRSVALHFEAASALHAQRDMLADDRIPAGARDLVFPASGGGPMDSNNLRNRELQPDLARAGLPRLSLNALRHTFASVMLHEWRVSPAVVSKMMGHASMSFTFDTYGHLIPSADADVMRALNASQKAGGNGGSGANGQAL